MTSLKSFQAGVSRVCLPSKAHQAKSSEMAIHHQRSAHTQSSPPQMIRRTRTVHEAQLDLQNAADLYQVVRHLVLEPAEKCTHPTTPSRHQIHLNQNSSTPSRTTTRKTRSILPIWSQRFGLINHAPQMNSSSSVVTCSKSSASGTMAGLQVFVSACKQKTGEATTSSSETVV